MLTIGALFHAESANIHDFDAALEHPVKRNMQVRNQKTSRQLLP